MVEILDRVTLEEANAFTNESEFDLIVDGDAMVVHVFSEDVYITTMALA